MELEINNNKLSRTFQMCTFQNRPNWRNPRKMNPGAVVIFHHKYAPIWRLCSIMFNQNHDLSSRHSLDLHRMIKQIAAYHDPLMIKSMIHDPLYESSKMTKQFGSSVVGLYPILAPHDELDWLLATDTTIPMLLGFGTCFRTSSYLKHPRSIHLIPSCNQT